MPSSVGSGGWVFFREFVRAPLWTASVVPSSPALAVAMGPPFPRPAVQGCRLVVVELGPGTGAFTQLIGQLAPTGTRHLCVELNPVMAAHLARRFPRVEVVTGAAADLTRILGGRAGCRGLT